MASAWPCAIDSASNRAMACSTRPTSRRRPSAALCAAKPVPAVRSSASSSPSRKLWVCAFERCRSEVGVAVKLLRLLCAPRQSDHLQIAASRNAEWDDPGTSSLSYPSATLAPSILHSRQNINDRFAYDFLSLATPGWPPHVSDRGKNRAVSFHPLSGGLDAGAHHAGR
jgi:hypothetical protein